jgi:hypothetical protein
LALPEDYINRTFQHPLDREIVLLLYRLRKNKLSSENIQQLCQIKHHHGGKEKPYGLRSVEEHLKILVDQGVINRETEIVPKKRTRPKYLFSIRDTCRQKIEDYVRTPTLEIGLMAYMMLK